MRRRLGPILLVAWLLAGCGGDDGDEAGSRPLDATVTTAVGGAGTTTTAASSGDGSTDPSVAATSTTGEGATSSTSAPPSAAIAPGDVGDLAAVVLRPGHGNRIVVEVRAQAGAAPASGTLEHVAGVLRDASGKTVATDGVDALGGGARSWTAGAIVAAADAAAELPQGGSQAVLRLLFLQGTFGGDESVLGVAVRGDVAAIFTDQVDAAAGLLVPPAVVEDAVAIHEVGHLLGLVDLVLATGRADPAHPGHSTNEHSVMFWAVESDVISQLLDGGIPNDFDAQDWADLARIRAG